MIDSKARLVKPRRYLPLLLALQFDSELIDEGDPARAGVGLVGGVPRHPEEGHLFVLQHRHSHILWCVWLD